jgi:molecular chaperone IbpA
MTRLEKEINEIIDAMLYPTRYAKAFQNVGSSYPPYNIIRLSDKETILEVAVAGFKEDEVSVTVEDGRLKVSGSKKDGPETAQYLYKGIGTRSFERSFALSKDTKVERAEYADGILSVYVHYEIPEEKKPKQIPIVKATSNKMLLTE